MKKYLFSISISVILISSITYALASITSQSQNELQQTQDQEPKNTVIPTQNRPKIQVVFALDCTGSMSGLIQAAKDKIWSIASGLSQVQSNPDISFGFVFYRDLGDSFVTKHIQLTNDMDMAYRELMEMQAQGGGDTPESVNKALYEAIHKFQWDSDNNVYKVVFLVGDAPPHMDYQDDVKYAETCNKAVKKDIIINTIQCGNMSETTPIWRDIAQRAGGDFLQLQQSGSEVVIRCPHDKEISRLMSVIDETRIYYGSSEMRVKMEDKANASAKIVNEASAEVQAKRAEFNYSNSVNNASYMGSNELISDIQSGKVKLADIKVDQLPEKMKKMTPEQREKYVQEMAAIRKAAEEKLAVQIRERTAYVEKEMAKLGESTINQSFSANVHNVVVKQAQSKNIVIDKKVKN